MTLDMFLHFISGVLIYIPCKYVFSAKHTLSIILLIALGKEVYDFISYGFYPLENIKDIFFTLLGPVYCLYFAKITKNS